METAAGQQCGYNLGAGECPDVARVDPFQMIRARRIELDGQLRGACPRELLSVQPWHEPAGTPRGQDAPRLVDAESAPITKNIAEFGEAFGGNGRDQLAREQLYVG